MAITSANNHVSIHNGITSAIATIIKMLKLKYYRHIFSDTHLVYIKVWSLTFSSDLRKPGLVPGESLFPARIFGSVLEKIKYTWCQTEWETSIYSLMHVCLHVYMQYAQAYIHTYGLSLPYICTYIHTYISNSGANTYIYIFIHVCLHTYICTNLHIHACLHKHAYQYIHVYIHTHIH